MNRQRKEGKRLAIQWRTTVFIHRNLVFYSEQPNEQFFIHTYSHWDFLSLNFTQVVDQQTALIYTATPNNSTYYHECEKNLIFAQYEKLLKICMCRLSVFHLSPQSPQNDCTFHKNLF